MVLNKDGSPFITHRLLAVLLSTTLLFGTTLSGCQSSEKGTKLAGADLFGPDEPFPFDAQQWLNETESSTLPLVANYRPIKTSAKDALTLYGTLYVPGLKPLKHAKVGHLPEDTQNASPEALSPEAANSEKPTGLAALWQGGKEKANNKANAADKPPKDKYPLIILSHGISDTQWSWGSLPATLMKKGYAVLVYDVRGHGKSIYKDNLLHAWRNFDRADWKYLPYDLFSLVGTIEKDPKLSKYVNTKRLGLIGADIGANASFHFAMADPKAVKFVVALSPGLEYGGVNALEYTEEMKQPVFFAVSTGDVYAYESTRELFEWKFGPRKLIRYKGKSHGTDMLGAQPSLAGDVLAWIDAVMPAKGQGLVDNLAARPNGVFDPDTTQKPHTRTKDKKKLEIAKKDDDGPTLSAEDIKAAKENPHKQKAAANATASSGSQPSSNSTGPRPEPVKTTEEWLQSTPAKPESPPPADPPSSPPPSESPFNREIQNLPNPAPTDGGSAPN